jgi:hypothetical protein
MHVTGDMTYGGWDMALDDIDTVAVFLQKASLRMRAQRQESELDELIRLDRKVQFA